MLKKCLIFKPAGTFDRRGNVQWYNVPFQEMVSGYFNIGDLFVFDSTLKLLDFEEYEVVNVDEPVDEARLDYLKTFDCILLRASNYIHPHMEWTNLPDWLDALPLPIICCGVGAQSARRQHIELPPAHRRLWRRIGERAKTIGVRGVFTAEVLGGLGVDNVEVVGCPTLFRGLDPTMSGPRRPTPTGGSRIAFSVRREIGAGYTEDEADFLAAQKNIIRKLAQIFDVTLSIHGEIEEKKIFFGTPDAAEARAFLRTIGWLDGPHTALEALYDDHLFFSQRISDFDAFNRSVDAAIGYRVHGVLPALAVGTPGVLVNYDMRSEELAEALDIPLMAPQEVLDTPTLELVAAERFNGFYRAFPQHYGRMKAFLERNDLKTMM